MDVLPTFLQSLITDPYYYQGEDLTLMDKFVIGFSGEESQFVKSRSGVISFLPDTATGFTARLLLVHTYREWHKERFSGIRQRPSCISLDMYQGMGSPGLKCFQCPQALHMENGSACQVRTAMFLLFDDGPALLDLPRSAHKVMQTLLRQWKEDKQTGRRGMYNIRIEEGRKVRWMRVATTDDKDITDRMWEKAEEVCRMLLLNAYALPR